MRRSRSSVGIVPHSNATQRSSHADCLRVSRQAWAEGFPQPLTHLPERKHLQSIGVYVSNFFGQPVRFRVLKEFGSTKSVACVAEIVYPDKFYGTRIGIPRGVLK